MSWVQSELLTILLAVVKGSKGTTNNAPTRPTATAGSMLRIFRELPLIVRAIRAAVITTGSKSSTSLQVLSLGRNVVFICDEDKKPNSEVALLGTNWVSTLPRHRLRKTNVALILRAKIMAIGRITIRARIRADVIFFIIP